MEEYPNIHSKVVYQFNFDRLDLLWQKYPNHHDKKRFTNLDTLLEEHESYQKDFTSELKEEYISHNYEQFLIQLSWDDLPYRYETKKLIMEEGEIKENSYVKEFLAQFESLDTTHKASFIFPESFTSQFFVVEEVCKRAEIFHPISNLFPDEKIIHYLAVFDKKNMDDVLLMFHLLYTSSSEQVFGGYSLYDYPLDWYHSHLRKEDTVFRSPYLPDQLVKYKENISFCHNPTKTVYVRRNIDHIIESHYFESELDFFRNLTEIILPFFQWWYLDIALYEKEDGFKTNWRLERTRIRTELTASGIINPKWKNEVTLFHKIHEKYPDTLYQYRPEWLNRQSLDLYIPSLNIAIEYQGIQHYKSVDFFGGEEALLKRQELDSIKKQLCEENHVKLIEWSYEIPPTSQKIKELINNK